MSSSNCKTKLPTFYSSSIHVLYCFTACSIFLVYLGDVMHAFEKICQLVIWDWYFSGRMEMITTKNIGNERKECWILVFVCLPIYCVYTWFLENNLILSLLFIVCVFIVITIFIMSILKWCPYLKKWTINHLPKINSTLQSIIQLGRLFGHCSLSKW